MDTKRLRYGRYSDYQKSEKISMYCYLHMVACSNHVDQHALIKLIN